ncbi:hypothetical protein HYU10_00295 [Candidatus Woesearchaeota archaeon]|nr:hypothetical protein [Candidatus Woesearchaeota archaeon]
MPEKIRFFPLDITYKVIDSKPVIHLYGRIQNGPQVCVLDSSFEPYFYVVPKEGIDIKEKLEKLDVNVNGEASSVTKTELVKRNYLGKMTDAFKVFTKLPRDVPVIREIVRQWDSIKSMHEFDIPFVRKYLIDRNIVPMTLYDAEGDYLNQKSRVPVFNAVKIEPAAGETYQNPKILAFDIETYSTEDRIDFQQNPILMLALYGENFRKVFVWKRFPVELDSAEFMEFVENEAELLEKFKSALMQFSPDLLVGYYSDSFDLQYIRTRAEINKVNLDIGLDYSGIKLGRGANETCSILGISHIDIYKFIRRIVLGFDSYSLSNVSARLLGQQKHDVDLDELPMAWDSNAGLLKFADYNLNDAMLTYNLADRMLPTMIEMVKMVGLPVFDISRMGFSQLVEHYIFRQAPLFNEMAPNKPSDNEVLRRRMQTYGGAFVFEPKPGLYKDITVFDYRSLYPTIIASHNICLTTLVPNVSEDSIKVDIDGREAFYFSKKTKGFIPSLISDIITRRTRIKEIIKEKKDEKYEFMDARQNSLKLLANSFYGYLGFANARWYSLECAKSVTALGRHYIHDVISKAGENGFLVLYSDSLPYDRYLFIKFKNGDIGLIKIGELYDKYRDIKGASTLAFDNGKVVFKPIVRVIRHIYKGKLLNIDTKYGSTIVTPQHSVYSFDSKSENICLVDAGKLNKGEKLISLTNPEIEVTYKEEHVFDIVELDMGCYSKELSLYSDNLVFPAKRAKCPYCNMECYLSNHVYLHHQERRASLNKRSLFSWVGGKNAKGRKIPRYWKLDEDLAWILGFYCAEGSVSDVTTNSGRKCLLSFGGQDNKIIEKVKFILDAKTGVSTEIIENYDKRINKKMFYYRVQCMPIIALFQYGFGAGKASEFKKVPYFIFTSEEKLRRAFIKGYLDGDGQAMKDRRYATHFTRFSTKSKGLAIGLHFLLKSLKHGNNFRGNEIKHVAWQYRKDKPKIQTLRLQSAKESKDNFCLAEILSIGEIPHEKYVYDVEVSDVHNFVDAEGMMLVHNTDSVFISVEGKSEDDAKKFVESVNAELPGLMELEYEGFYPYGLFVSAKVGSFGAKKKYALVRKDGSLKIRGFEMVRRNWSPVAKNVQEKVLDIILREREPEKAVKYVKDIIRDLKEKRIPVSEVIIHTQLTKDIIDYASKGPHVAVAQRLRNLGKSIGPGSVIKYVVTQGSDIIRNRSKLPEEVTEKDYDADYYIHHQVVPAVERILGVLGYTKEELTESHHQKKLEGFF